MPDSPLAGGAFRLPVLLLLGTLLLLPAGLTAQENGSDPSVSDAVSRLEIGQEIRLIMGGERIDGPLLYSSDQVIELREGMRQRRVPIDAVRELQVRRDGRSWGLPLALVGAGAGALAFGVGDLGIGGDKEKQGDALNPFLGAVVGSLVGAAIGSLIGGDYWETVGAR